MMTSRSVRKRRSQLRVRSIGEYVYDDVEEEGGGLEEMIEDDDGGTSSRENEMQIVCYSEPPSAEPFTLPNGWFVEQKPRPSKPSHVDKYYYEPGTGKKFRSLLAVQRYLKMGTIDCRTTKRLMSENENTTSIEHGTGQQRFRSLRTIERYITAENACTAIPKSMVKAGNGNQSPCGLRSWQRSVRKRASMTDEGDKDKVTLDPLKHSAQSVHPNKSDSLKKINFVKDNTTSKHNLSRPPEKVTWVLSGPGGLWSPYVEDSIVPESEKLKWSEAFVLSTHERQY